MAECNITNENFLMQIKSLERAIVCLETIKNNCIRQIEHGSQVTIFLDSYDILHWFFPPGISYHDHHYPIVHNLWKTVEKYIPPGPRPIHLCIPPFSALEMFHLLKIKSDQLSRIKIPGHKNISTTYYNKLISEVGALYTAVNEITEVLRSHPDKGPLLQAFKRGHIKALQSFIDVDKINKAELLRIIGRELDINPGYKYIISLRERYRENISDKSLSISAAFDMANLGLVTYLRDKAEALLMFPLMITHGLFTIFGWERSVRNPDKKSFSHSLLALYLVKGLQRTNDLKEFKEVIDGALGLCIEYLKQLRRNEGYRSRKNRKADELVKLSRKELIARSAWIEMFQQPYFSLESFASSQERRKPSTEELIDWHDERRQKQKELIQENVKLIESRANFIDPDLVSILVDKNELVDEILDYARP